MSVGGASPTVMCAELRERERRTQLGRRECCAGENREIPCVVKESHPGKVPCALGDRGRHCRVDSPYAVLRRTAVAAVVDRRRYGARNIRGGKRDDRGAGLGG